MLAAIILGMRVLHTDQGAVLNIRIDLTPICPIVFVQEFARNIEPEPCAVFFLDCGDFVSNIFQQFEPVNLRADKCMSIFWIPDIQMLTAVPTITAESRIDIRRCVHACTTSISLGEAHMDP